MKVKMKTMNNRKTKTKENQNMENAEEKEVMSVDKIGHSIQRELNKFYTEWQGGLEYRSVMSSQGYRAKCLGMDVGELSDQLESKGYIKVLRNPKGKRFVFSGDCPMTMEEMQEWLQEQEIIKESQKDMKKQLKAQA